MLLIFDEVPNQGLRIDCKLDLPQVAVDGSGRPVAGPVHLAGHAAHGTRGLELTARLDTTLQLECSRCLAPVEHAVRCDFFLVLVSEAVEFGTREMRTASEDAQLFYAGQGRADLREIATEQIYLNLPQKVVCRDDCAGLCPTCGANRNRIECRCRPDDLDLCRAPWLALKQELKG